MAIRTYDILLDSYNSTIPEPIVGRQGDKNGAVTLHVTITDRGTAVDLTDQTINLMAETAKGTAIVADTDGVTVTNATGGKFDYAIPNALWSEAGKITKAYFSLNGANGQQTTYDLIFIVKKAVDISQGKADDYVTIIDGTLRSLKEKIDAMNTDVQTVLNAYNQGDFYNKSETDNWQKHKLTGDDGSAKLVIASGDDVNTKLKAIIGTKDTGKLLVDIDAKNNPTGGSLIGEYFCDFDGLTTGYGIGPDGAMWNFTYNGTTTIWKLILTGNKPGIPSLTAEYNSGKKGFDYTITAPKSDGGSEITGYSLEYQKQGSTDWTKVALNPDSLTGTVTDGIEAGSDYLFRVNAENAVGSSDYFTVSEPLPTVDGNIYGVSWDGSSSGALQRTDAAVGLKAGINGAQNDFDTRGPWGLMDKTVTDSYGNAFVRVPKFYIRKTQDKSKPLSTWQVSLVKQGDDWYLPNCFYDFDTKKELDYVDVSRYEGFIESGHLKSKSGVNPTSSVDINDFRTAATALNVDGKKGYHLWDVHTLDALQVLFTIEFATLDSQSIMKGVTDDVLSGAEVAGAADGVKGSSGNVDHSNVYGSMTYRGIENLYGNLAMWTDGLNINNLSLYSCDDATKYASDVFTSPYYKLNYSLNSMNGNITGLGFDKDHPGVTAPTSVNSDSYNTYYHDYGYINGSGNYVVYTGGSWDWPAGGSGLWCWNGGYSSTDASSLVGSRLLKKAL